MHTIDSLEEWHDLVCEFLSCSESLGVQHDLGDQVSVGFGHRQISEEFLQIVRQVGAASIAWVHGDEDGHVWIDLDLLANKFHTDLGSWRRTNHTHALHKTFALMITSPTQIAMTVSTT